MGAGGHPGSCRNSGTHSCGSAPDSHRLPPPGRWTVRAVLDIRAEHDERSPDSTRPAPARDDAPIAVVTPTPVPSPVEAAGGSRFHALAWTAWVLGALVCLQIAPNVLDVSIVILVSVVVAGAHGRRDPGGASMRLVVGLSVAFGLIRVLITALTVHDGGRVLFSLPITGAVVLEPIVRTAAESFVIVGIVVAFSAWNRVVSHHELLAGAPRALHELALVGTIALAFIPCVIDAIGRARESDRARTGGIVVRRGRVLRTLLPVLETALERAVLLAQTMDARGFAHSRTGGNERRAAALCILGLLTLLGALAALSSRADAAAGVLALLGLGLMIGAMVVAGRSNQRRRYRPRPLRADDALLIGASLAAPLLVALGDPAVRHWDAGSLSLPPFDAVAALGLLLLCVPALLPGRDR